MAPIFTGSKFGFGRSAAAASIPTITATGGTVTAAGITPGNGYRYHVFVSPGNFVVSEGTTNIEYLVVAGGGGGGNGHGGGGGGGGLRTNVAGDPRSGSPVPVSPGTYAVVVGTGGDAAANDSWPQPFPGPGRGVDSSIAFPTPIVSAGGGMGGNNDVPGAENTPRSGGSGGGGCARGTPAPSGNAGGAGNAPPTSPIQGYSGGQGLLHPGPTANNPVGYTGGGGGGAGGAGTNASPGNGGAGAGGPGYPVPAFAAPLIAPEIPAPVRPAWTPAVGPTGLYAGGGGGGGYYAAGPTTGAGGPGGGSGGFARGGDASPGIFFTGGGGGSTISGLSPGQDGQNLNEGAGGTGIVVIRYLA